VDGEGTGGVASSTFSCPAGPVSSSDLGCLSPLSRVVAFLGRSLRAPVMLVLNRFRPSPVPPSAEVSFASMPDRVRTRTGSLGVRVPAAAGVKGPKDASNL